MSEGGGPKDPNPKLILVSVFSLQDLCQEVGNEDLIQESIFFFFWLCCVAHGILILQPEIESIPPALKTQSLNHWTARVKSPKNLFLSSDLKIQMLTSGIYYLFLKREFPENHLSIYNHLSGVLDHLSTAPPSHRQDQGRQQPRENHCNQE